MYLFSLSLSLDTHAKLLEGLEGVVCHMDDVLVVGRDQEQHNARLTKVLERIESAELTLNAAKCKFSRASVKFPGHCISKEGIRADPDKYAGWNHFAPQETSEGLWAWLIKWANFPLT